MGRRPLLAALVAGILIVLGSGCDYLGARDHLNKGVAAFKTARFKEATEHFKQAIAMDPNWDVPQLYLAMTYMKQWIPGAGSAENKEFAEQARGGFKKVLERTPKDTTALASLASMAFSEATAGPPEARMAKLDEAAMWNQKRIEADPNSAEAYYSLGVISYDKWEPDWLAARTELKMKRDDPGPLKDAKIRDELQSKDGTLLDSAMKNLNKALEIDAEYDNAYTYKNMVLRTKADLLDNKKAYDDQIAQADQLIAKSLEVRKIKMERNAKKASSGIVQE